MGCGQSKAIILSSLNSETTKLETQKKTSEHEKSTLESRYAKEKQEFHERFEQKKQLDAEEPHLTNSIKDLTEKIAAVKVHNQDPKEVHLRKEIEKKDHDLQALHHHITELLSTKSHIEQQISEEFQKVSETQMKLDRNLSENSNLDSKLEEICENEGKLAEKNTIFANLQQKLAHSKAQLIQAQSSSTENKKNLQKDSERSELRHKNAHEQHQSENLTERLAKTESTHQNFEQASKLLSTLEVELAGFQVADEERTQIEQLSGHFQANTEKLEVLKDAKEKFGDLNRDKEELIQKKTKLEGRLAKIKGKISVGNEEIEVCRPVCEHLPEDELDSKDIRKELKSLKEKQEKKLAKIKEAQDKINKKMQKHGHLFG